MAFPERIRAGETLLGTFLDLGSPLAAEIAASAGFDWLVIDLEHGAGDRDATLGHLGVRAAGYGRDAGYLAAADAHRSVMIQIETRGALDAVEEIAALPGVDVLFVGPYDLGHALGVTPGPESPEVLHAAERTAAAARSAGKASAVFVGDPGLARRYRELGFTLIASGSAVGLLAGAMDARLAALRA